MGEILLNHLVTTNESLSRIISCIDSCGTIDYHAGDDPDSRCLQTARKLMGQQIKYSKSRKIRKQDFSDFDYILCCDKSNLEDVKELRKKWKVSEENGPVVALLGQWDPQGQLEVRDPYYDRGASGFEQNYQHMLRCLEAFIAEVSEEVTKDD